MTDIELLPLPEWMSTFIVPDGGKEVGCDHRLSALMKHYARANMEPLIAEIEALVHDLEQTRANVVAEHEARIEAEVRAERLEEVFLELCNVIDGHEVPVAVEGKAAHARDALRDHDQEVSNG